MIALTIFCLQSLGALVELRLSASTPATDLSSEIALLDEDLARRFNSRHDTPPSRPPRFLHAVLSMALLGMSHACFADDRYELDPEHLTIGFLVRHLGYADTLGFFRKATGSYTFDEASRTLRDVKVVVETNSVFTGHDKRDGHLRGGDFLDASSAPRMTFTASAANWTGDKTFKVDGELELLGQRKPLQLTGTLNKSGVYPIGGSKKPYVQGVSLRGKLKRSEWGMDYAVANGWVGDEVDLIIEFEARRVE